MELLSLARLLEGLRRPSTVLACRFLTPACKAMAEGLPVVTWSGWLEASSAQLPTIGLPCVRRSPPRVQGVELPLPPAIPTPRSTLSRAPAIVPSEQQRKENAPELTPPAGSPFASRPSLEYRWAIASAGAPAVKFMVDGAQGSCRLSWDEAKPLAGRCSLSLQDMEESGSGG
jgi:hypothetical protein